MSIQMKILIYFPMRENISWVEQQKGFLNILVTFLHVL